MPTWVSALLGIFLIIVLLPFFIGGAALVEGTHSWWLVIVAVVGSYAAYYIRRKYPQPWMLGLPNTETPKNNQLTSISELAEDNVSIEAETKKCPMCAETIKLEALKCRFCGHLFDTYEVEQEVERRIAEIEEAKIKEKYKNMTQCPKCGQWNVHRAFIEDGGQGDWCPHCKESLKKMRGEI